MTEYSQNYGDSALEATLGANPGAGADYALAPNLRFQRAVAILAKRRFVHRSEAPSEHPIIFVQAAQGPSANNNRASVRIPMIDNGRTAIGGHLWFMNAAGTEAKGLELADSDTDIDLFDLVRSDPALKDRPAVIIETRDGLFEMRWYPGGLAKDDQVEVTDLTRKEISSSDVKKVLDDIWRESLCSPTALTSAKTGPWQKASDYHPHSDAELRIQTILESGLKEAFKGFEVRHEQTQPTGRLDLEIEEPHELDESTVTRHMLLELKVVRDFSESGKTSYSDKQNLDVIEEGVRQARLYREERKVRASALCCYDMRKQFRGDSALDDVRDDAAEWGVELWLWHLFGESSEYRKFLESEISV